MVDSTHKIKVNIVQCSISKGDPLQLVITDFDAREFTSVSYGISKVDDDYTNWVLSSSSNVVFEDGVIKINCGLSNHLDNGFYFLSSLQFIKPIPQCAGRGLVSPSPINGVSFNINNFGLLLFEIRNSGEPPHSAGELLSRYENIIKKRNEKFLSGIGEARGTNGSIEYTAIVFAKNCLITNRMRLGKYEIIPVGNLPYTDEIEKVKSILKNIGITASFNYEEIKSRGENGVPVFIVHFPIVRALTKENAIQLIFQETQSLCNILSIQRGSSPSIFGTILIDNKSNQCTLNIVYPIYTGNLLGGIISGEDPKGITDRIEKLKNNNLLQLYLSLYSDILIEKRADFSYFRCWNLLETIARHNNYIGQPLLNWQGTQLVNNNGNLRFIRDDAKELVFELIRRAYTTLNVGKPGDIENQIKIWYRHRNCTGHSGGCLPNDSTHCSRTDPQYIECKKAYDAVVAKCGIYHYSEDDSYQLLKQALDVVMWYELK